MAAADPLPLGLVAVLRFSAHNANVTTDAVLGPRVREAFGCSLIRYRQRLAAAVAHPGAEAVEPAEVRRLRSLLDAATAKRRRAATIVANRGA